MKLRSDVELRDAVMPLGQRPVLAVDLDGTLLRSDLLWEGLVRFLSAQPWRVGSVLSWWWNGGRSGLKANLAARTSIDGALLPWNLDVVKFCTARAAEGWRVVIATAANERAAASATAHFAFVAKVIGSDQTKNLKSEEKAARLVAEFGDQGFEYVGDSAADLPVWKMARNAWFVGSSAAGRLFSARLGGAIKPLGTSVGFSWRSLAVALRPHQWLKNLLVFLPLLTAHRWNDAACWRELVPVFFAVSCMASASYLLNDLSDLDADRGHARKKFRPLANGSLPIPAALLAICVLLSLGTALAAASGLNALGATVAYFVLSAFYSLVLKTRPVIDAVFLAGLYTYRMVLGGIAASIMISGWLLAFSTTFFLGLAFLKRYVEIDSMPPHATQRVSRRGYRREDLAFVQITGISSSFLSVVVLALYLDSSASSALYVTPHWLWAIALALLLWNMRVWFLAGRKRMHDDPVWFAAKDPATFALCAFCIGVVAAAGPLR